jgi:hypothetical protein
MAPQPQVITDSTTDDEINKDEPSNRQIFDAILGLTGDVREMKQELLEIKEVLRAAPTPRTAARLIVVPTAIDANPPSAPQLYLPHVAPVHNYDPVGDQTMAHLQAPMQQWSPNNFGQPIGYGQYNAPSSLPYTFPTSTMNQFQFEEGSSIERRM